MKPQPHQPIHACPFCNAPDAGKMVEESYVQPGTLFECGTTILIDGRMMRGQACAQIE